MIRYLPKLEGIFLNGYFSIEIQYIIFVFLYKIKA